MGLTRAGNAAAADAEREAHPVGVPPAVEGATADTSAVSVKFSPYTMLSAVVVKLMAVSACRAHGRVLVRHTVHMASFRAGARTCQCCANTRHQLRGWA